MTYQGGPVISNAEIIPVYMGIPDPTFANAMDHFYSEIQRDGRYLNWLSEYSTPTQTIGSGTVTRSYWIPSPGSPVDQAGIGAYLDHEIHIGALPDTSPNTIYMVHVAPSINVISGAVIFGIPAGASAGQGSWCAMHVSYISPSTGRGTWRPAIVYAILPNPGCGSDLNSQTFEASHELIEAITDPMSAYFSEGFLSYTAGQGPFGWTDPSRSGLFDPREIADLCNDRAPLTTSPSDTFVVSTAFSNSRGRCYSP